MGFSGIVLSGGEPTVRKDFIELIKSITAAGMEAGVISNGRIFSYPDFTQSAIAAGLRYAYISLHSGDPNVQDALTRAAGSFSQTSAGLVNLAKFTVGQLVCNAVVTSKNLDVLQELVHQVARLGRVELKFTYVEPKGLAAQDPELIPHPCEAAEAIEAALLTALNLGMPENLLGVDGLPHCLSSLFPRFRHDMFESQIVALFEPDDDDFYPVDYRNMRKAEICRECGRGDYCKGTWQGIFDLFGTEFLNPYPSGKSNSFNYFFQQSFPANAVVQQSTVNASELEQDLWRSISLKKADMIEQYTTDTGDFTSHEIQQIAGHREQIYLQKSAETYISDFSKELIKLQLVGTARFPSSGSNLVTPLFKPVKINLFQKSEKQILKILKKVAGRVLDVGAGSMRYRTWLEQMLQKKRITYVAVEPKPGKYLTQMAQQGRLELIVDTIEAASLPKTEFDWVFVLRSHNHLLDLWTAYKKIVGCLRWGGELLVVDNVPFALVRPHSIVRSTIVKQAVSLPEHRRNHHCAQALDFFYRFPLLPTLCVPVTRHSANQWILVMQKRWPSRVRGNDAYI